MSCFNPAMLTASPEPETPPSPTHNQPMVDNPIPEESDADRIHHEELLEEQESWMRDWHTVLEQMNECFGHMQNAQVELTLDAQGAKALEDSKKEYQKLEKLVKGWKVKAVKLLREKSVVPTNNVGEPAVVEKTALVDAVPSKEVADMGVPMFLLHWRKAVFLLQLANALFSEKADAKPKPAKTKLQARNVYCTAVWYCPYQEGRPYPVTTIANNADTSGDESEVEMQVEIQDESGEKRIGDVAGEEDFVRGSKTILPCPVLPLPKQPTPAPKCKLDASEREELEALQLEVVSLWEENEELRIHMEWYGDTLIHARQHVRAQEAE
ncbi:uncharacterized protein HD556DRAFT_1441414 [Suillus plorans]|uniref:Uncharacterized protein n=1 Tax=Suillus plorans TaxID=116603 RepID=A0A9P7DJK9_9AGAM|nr:uncharacterized protein HD556DRAFT_1441414 [Suillus plorans]KAG1796725.1 hypothetical protein HD556DRAFT_1441414 [Suillus plorans]